MTEQAPPPPNIEVPENASPESVFHAFAQLDPQRYPQHQEQPKEQKQPEPKEEKKPEEVKTGVPESLLGLPAEEKKPEADDYDTLIKEEPKGQVKHEHYQRLKNATSKKVQALQAEAAEYKAKLEAAEKRTVPEEYQTRYAELEKVASEREALIERLNIQESPKFKERFTNRETAISERLKKTATEFGLDAESLQVALAASPKRRAELLNNLEVGEAEKSMLTNMMVQYDMIQDEKGSFLSQSKEQLARERLEQQEAMQRQEQERAAYEKKVFSEVGERMRKSFSPFQRVEGNDEWNKGAEALEAEAEKYFNGQLPLENLAEVVYKGVGAQRIELINAELHKRLTAALKELGELKQVQPGANGHMPAPDGKRQESSDPMRRAMDTFNRMKAEGAGPYNNGGF